MSLPPKHFFTFDGFQLQLPDKLLLFAGESVPLPPKAMELLLFLVANNGRVLTKEELMAQLWPDSFVEEANLSHNIFLLRRAFSERLNGNGNGQENAPLLIETIPRRGYRFAAQVTELQADELNANGAGAINAEENLTVPVAATDSAFTATTPAPPHQSFPAKYGLLAAGLGVIGLIFWWNVRAPQPAKTVGMPFAIQRLTQSGTSGGAAISPDGKYIAYRTGQGPGTSLWVQQLANGSKLQLTAPADAILNVSTFSRDGGYVYYVTSSVAEPQGALYRVAALGGRPEKILARIHGNVALSPDGKQLAFRRKDKDSSESRLMVANVDGTNERVLLARRGGEWIAGTNPAWSPDGKQVACGLGKTDEAGQSFVDIVSVDISNGKIRAITAETVKELGAMQWLSDNRGLMMTAQKSNERSQVFFLPLPNGTLQHITNDVHSYSLWTLGVTADGQALISTQYTRFARLWKMPLTGDAAQAMPLSSGIAEGTLALYWLPNGSIVYSSRNGEKANLWQLDLATKATQQITDQNATARELTASPDGRYLFFALARDEQQHIWRCDATGENLQQLTSGAALDGSPNCTPDGKWVLYSSTLAKKTSLWKVPVTGGAPVLVAERGGNWPALAPDGKRIVVTQHDASALQQYQIAILDATTGAVQKAFPVSSTFEPRRMGWKWMPDSRSLIYVDQQANVSNLWQQSLEGGAPKQITRFQTDLIYQFAFSPDGREIVLSRGQSATDIVQMKNFMQPE